MTGLLIEITDPGDSRVASWDDGPYRMASSPILAIVP
jgi:hypothetical protein